MSKEKKQSKVERARKIKADGYKCIGNWICKKCPFRYKKGGANKCELKKPCDMDTFKKAVDDYIKRYDRSKKVSRPNFIKALKGKKEFCVYPEDIETLKELVVSSGVKRAIIGRSLNGFIADANGIKFCHSSSKPIEYLIFATASNPVDLPEYLPLTDTFTETAKMDNSETPPDLEWVNEDHVADASKKVESKKEDPETLKTPIIKLKADCVVITEEEFKKLKQIELKFYRLRNHIEAKHNEIRKMLED